MRKKALRKGLPAEISLEPQIQMSGLGFTAPRGIVSDARGLCVISGYLLKVIGTLATYGLPSAVTGPGVEDELL